MASSFQKRFLQLANSRFTFEYSVPQEPRKARKNQLQISEARKRRHKKESGLFQPHCNDAIALKFKTNGDSFDLQTWYSFE